jgi:mersacidin/lichenicidin family type 2 lantibiotic
MSKLDVILAWRDAEYRVDLGESQQAILPDNPAGALDLSDLDLASVAGGTWTQIWAGCGGTDDFIICQSIVSICPPTVAIHNFD